MKNVLAIKSCAALKNERDESSLEVLFSSDIFPNILVVGVHQLVRGAIKDNLSLSQDEKCSMQIALGAFGQRQHLVFLGIEIRAGHNEGVLQAVRDHQRAGLVNVALLHNKLDDAGRSDGVKAGRG